MSVSEAVKFFKNIPNIYRKIKTLESVGLGYITLGQQATTLSGGEAQRVKLSEELSKKDELLKKESKIISSPSYKSYVETKSKLDQLQEEEKKLRYSLDEHFVKISRPLNKYVHIVVFCTSRSLL
jgi:excinuclease UvrABC ATPase subunit